MSEMSSSTHRLFPTTSRTLVESLNSPDQKAREVSLARFCSGYYPALYGFARSLGLSEADAKDRVQDFFVEVVRDELLAKFDLERGTRLSSWLMRCFQNLVLNHHASQAAWKRGGGQIFEQFDSEHAEHSYRAAHLAHLEPGPTFDLMLAREIWQAARSILQTKHAQKGHGALVADLLPLILLHRWPSRPMPTQEELAQRHDTTLLRLKAFFNRTLKAQARRAFNEEAMSASPGIPEAEISHLWNLLSRYGES